MLRENLELWSLVSRRRRYQLGVLLVCAVVSTLSEALSIGAVIPFLGLLVAAPEFLADERFAAVMASFGIADVSGALLFCFVVFFVSVVFSAFLRLLVLAGQTYLGYRIGAELSDDVFNRCLFQPIEFHRAKNSNEIIAAAMNKAQEVIDHNLMPALLLMSSTLMLAVILGMLCFINFRMALLGCLSISLVYFIVVVLLRDRLYVIGKIVDRELITSIRLLRESLDAIREIIISQLQERYLKSFSESNRKLRKSYADRLILGSFPKIFIETFVILIIASFGFILSKEDGLLIAMLPTMAAFVLGAQRLLPVSQQIYFSWSRLRTGDPVLNEVLAFLRLPFRGEKNSPDYKPSLSFDKTIELKSVHFRYPNREEWVLRNLSITIPKGRRVAIVGASGSGKSTVLDIVMGLIEPTDGEVLIDGKKLTTEYFGEWRKNIALVPQSIYLLDGSIKDNVAFGLNKKDLDLVGISKALDVASLSKEVSGWSRGLETSVGEFGDGLSGGQRQRIGMARAIYKNSPILVLDEATSALDWSIEKDVIDNVFTNRPDQTVIIVSHRHYTLEGCDLIYKLNEFGGVEWSGKYEDFIGLAEENKNEGPR